MKRPFRDQPIIWVHRGDRTPVDEEQDAIWRALAVNRESANGYFDDDAVRRAAYRALFAGAHRHTYGAKGVFQCWKGGEPDRFGVRLRWDEALTLPGADHMRHARRLIESRPFFDRVPDRLTVPDDGGQPDDPVLVTRAADGAYAFVYVPNGRRQTINRRRFGVDAIVGHRFDPRRGTAETIGR